MSAKQKDGLTENGATELTEEETAKVDGGILIGLLLPAVQKVREAAARDQVAPTPDWPTFKSR